MPETLGMKPGQAEPQIRSPYSQSQSRFYLHVAVTITALVVAGYALGF